MCAADLQILHDESTGIDCFVCERCGASAGRLM
jgi:hypothetical protein